MPAKNGQNTVWGWAKISKLTSGNPTFAETFHLSRLNMAEARYKFGLTQKEAEKRAKILENAKNDLWITYKLHPDLGGEATSEKYNRILKQVQKSLGNAESGLAEFKERDATATEKSTAQ